MTQISQAAVLPKSLIHHFLIPSQTIDDDRFVDALIYICRHQSQEGAFGFIINKPLSFLSVGSVLSEMNLPASQALMNTNAVLGGFLHDQAGFVLHTGLPVFASSFAVGENVCLTTSKDVLKNIALDKLSHFLLCMGFCRWSKGQLEQEILNKKWLVCPADLSILFGADFEKRLLLAKTKLGILPDLEQIVGYA